MASFVLIHGSWHGGWCFDEVAALLRADGHEVFAPDLPGMGGDEAELAAVTLEGWGRFAAEQCHMASQSPVVLAGHSRGGLVVTQAAETEPDAMDAIVYICAMMMPNGMSRADFKSLEEPNPDFDALIEPTQDGHGTVITGSNPEQVFAQLSPPERVKPAMERLVAEPHGPRSTRLYPTPERWGSLPRTYIECTKDRTIWISSQRKMQELSPGTHVVTLESDHSPFLCCPKDLAENLSKAVQTAEKTKNQHQN